MLGLNLGNETQFKNVPVTELGVFFRYHFKYIDS